MTTKIDKKKFPKVKPMDFIIVLYEDYTDSGIVTDASTRDDVEYLSVNRRTKTSSNGAPFRLLVNAQPVVEFATKAATTVLLGMKR